MDLLFLEALGAGLLFIFIVWWTMFSGRRGGEPASHQQPPPTEAKPSASDQPPR